MADLSSDFLLEALEEAKRCDLRLSFLLSVFLLVIVFEGICIARGESLDEEDADFEDFDLELVYERLLRNSFSYSSSS
jgi:hypothetical protein